MATKVLDVALSRYSYKGPLPLSLQPFKTLPANCPRAYKTSPKGAGSKLSTVKLDTSIEIDTAEAVARLQTEHKVSSIDVTIANTGISIDGAPIY